MALQDQTLANTQAKMGLELARLRRERNAQATFASVTTGGPRRPAELPWWAAKDVPRGGVSRAQQGLQGLGGLMLGVAGRKAVKQAQHRTDPDYATRGLRGRAISERVPTAADFSRREGLGPAGMSPAQVSSLRVSLQTLNSDLGGLWSRIPASVFETLGETYSSGGQNGAPAGGGLPELGV